MTVTEQITRVVVTEDVENVVVVEEITATEVISEYEVANITLEVNSIEVIEALTGTIDNENTVFTTTYSYIPESTKVFINGLKLQLGEDYTESGDKEITFDIAPQNFSFTDKLEIIYYKQIVSI